MKKATLSIIMILNAVLAFSQAMPIITRLEGVGAGENFLELAEGEYDKILSGFTHGEVTYMPGAAPISVQIVNPLDVKDGEYLITFVDPIPGDTLSLDTRWILLSVTGDTLAIAVQTLAQLNEQLIAELGISILIGQSDDAGDQKDTSNGTIGYSLTYTDPGKPQWLTFVPDDLENVAILNFVQTEIPEYPNFIFDPEQAFSDFAPFVPYYLADYAPNEPAENPFGWNITPAWLDPSGLLVQYPQFGNSLQALNNVDIILTSDTSKWSRCVVIETANQYYTSIVGPGLGLESEGNKRNFTSRAKLSVGKRDIDFDGFPDPDGALDDSGNPLTGMGWFPGYAIDVETGERLNIFFGENTVYRDFVAEALGLGTTSHDMVWNPGAQIVLEGTFLTPLEMYVGGQHYVYVTREKYDGCEEIRKAIDRTTAVIKARELAKITWTAIPILVDDPMISFLPLNEGLIPNDVTIKIRVDNPYQLATGNGQFNDYPTYRFKLEGITALEESSSMESSFILYPNPTTHTVTIEGKNSWTGKTIIRIYNLNGALVLSEEFENQQKMDMDVSTLVHGMYFVDIRNNADHDMKKLLIQQ